MTVIRIDYDSERSVNDASITQERWDELHDSLVLALDALGTCPADCSIVFLRDSVRFAERLLSLDQS